MKRPLLYALLCLHFLGLVLLYGFYATGLFLPTYLFEAKIVDPRDYLRGDYVILYYHAINECPKRFQDKYPPNSTVYVALKKYLKSWRIENVTDQMPKGNEKLFLKARLNGSRLTYDIEKYFVPEGKGNPPGNITVAITIRPNGQTQIKQLYSDGKPWP